MQCKYHPDRTAEVFCTSCNAPLCRECAEEAKPGQYYCFECAMLHSISQVGTSIKDRRDRGTEKKEKERKKWGPFSYFVVIASVLILVMWAVIIFGGQPAHQRTTDLGTQGRVLLFMVDGAIKRYAHYEGNRYPTQLTDLVPKYLTLNKEELVHLKTLTYERDPNRGYRLSLSSPKAGQMGVTLSPKGVEYTAPSSGGV
jgi:hypothetical protein